jgi:hypothetical protein
MIVSLTFLASFCFMPVVCCSFFWFDFCALSPAATRYYQEWNCRGVTMESLCVKYLYYTLPIPLLSFSSLLFLLLPLSVAIQSLF